MTWRILTPLVALALLVPALPIDAGAGVSPGPDNIVVARAGWTVQEVQDNLNFPTQLTFKDGKLLVLEAGRYHYAEKYDPDGTCDPANGEVMNCGQLRELTLAGDGTVASQRVVVDGLADPIGLEVAPDGDVFLTQYGKISFIDDADFAATPATVQDWSTGHPAQTDDFVYTPVTATKLDAQAEALGADTTGPMGLAFHPTTGTLHATQGIHGQPPDDVIVRDITGLDYDNPYSSSVLAPDQGPLEPSEVVARACRNCYDLAFAPDGHDFGGELFITENVGPYRARLAAGEDRTALEGSTPADQNFLDGINHVDLETGQITRVVSLRTDSAIFGITPTGITYAPPGFDGELGDQMFVTLMSGAIPETNDRGQIVVAYPDFTTGVGTHDKIVVGLDHPIDLAFGPDGALYVIEFYQGRLYRLAPSGM